MDLLTLGKIINAHGLDGTLVVFSSTDFATLRYKEKNKLYILNPYNKEIKDVTVISYRNYKGNDYVKFEEIESIDEAIKLKGFEICIKKEDASTPEGYYHFFDLENCKIIDQNNNEIGKVIKVEEFPAQITLRCIDKNNKNFFVPFIKDVFILDVDIDNKTIKINLIEGMLWKK